MYFSSTHNVCKSTIRSYHDYLPIQFAVSDPFKNVVSKDLVPSVYATYVGRRKVRSVVTNYSRKKDFGVLRRVVT